VEGREHVSYAWRIVRKAIFDDKRPKNPGAGTKKAARIGAGSLYALF
jgi:hypothetical protein